MDGLVVLLLIIGLIARVSKSKKKTEQSRKRQAGFNDAAELTGDGAKPSPAKKAAKVLEVMDEAAGQIKIPYTKEEWSKFLKESGASAEKQPSRDPAAKRTAKALLRSGDPALISQMKAAQPKDSAAEGQVFEKLAAQRLRPAQQHLEGESHKEHAAHRQRIADEETRLHREREELRELRNVNLKKLRSAVVMSEVLGKPVSLRGRR